jgi:AcrR family transcriptional regulator
MSPGAVQSRSRRVYRSSIKRGEAAPSILAAAARLFRERGFAATSIDDIAREASVARPTVFAAVGSKAVIFRAVLEAAVAGDEQVVPVAQQRWLHRLLAVDDAHELLGGLAHQVRLIGERISELYWAAECAAEHDDAVRELWLAVEGERLATGPVLAARLDAIALLRDGCDQQTAATVLTTILSPATWRALVRDAGWSPDRFESWAAETLALVLLQDGDAQGRATS